MSLDVWIFEGVKLAAQLIGALGAAWLAVRWALHRYKREQIWTRQLAAYSDALTALGAMQRTLSAWYDDSLLHRKVDEDFDSKRRERYAEAMRQLIYVETVSLLLLSVRSQRIVGNILRDYEKLIQRSGMKMY